MVSPIKLPFVGGFKVTVPVLPPLCVCGAYYIYLTPSPLTWRNEVSMTKAVFFEEIELPVDQGDNYAFVNLLIIQDPLVLVISPPFP